MPGLSRILRYLLAVGAAALVVLVVTGAWLTRYYRPSPSFGGLSRRGPAIAVAIGVHRAAAGALILATGLLVGVRLASAGRRAVPAGLAVLSGVALVVTGRRLAWGQLALRAVKADLDAAGMLFAAFDPMVRFVLVPGVGEMSPSTFRVLLGVHTVLLPLALVGLLAVESRVQRRRDSPAAPGT